MGGDHERWGLRPMSGICMGLQHEEKRLREHRGARPSMEMELLGPVSSCCTYTFPTSCLALLGWSDPAVFEIILSFLQPFPICTHACTYVEFI